MAKKLTEMTIDELKARIEAKVEAELDVTAEKTELARRKPVTGKATKKAPEPEEEPAEEAFEPIFVDCNVDSFNSGGGGWIAPEEEGMLPGVCSEVIMPEGKNQLWFAFTHREGEEPEFRGALICGALDAEPPKGGAWKIKQVLDVLGCPYEEAEDGTGVNIVGNPVGKECQVVWAEVTVKGKTSMRITDVLPTEAETSY